MYQFQFWRCKHKHKGSHFMASDLFKKIQASRTLFPDWTLRGIQKRHTYFDLMKCNRRVSSQKFKINTSCVLSTDKRTDPFSRPLCTYSHLSNKPGAHVYRFWKIPPSTKQKSTLHVYWILRFFHPPLLVY